jgi:membrane-associated phospholipid phosphatase
VEILWNAGLQIVLWFQSLGAWLVVPMRAFSFLGQEEFFLVAMPAFYWCLDGGLGLRVAGMLLFSANLSCYLKILLHGPRPFWYSPQVQTLSSETTFGLPSAHAQNAAGIWGLLAALQRRRWLWALVLIVIFVIGISRLYLGMHFPTDVLAGWAIGFLLVWAFMRLDRPLSGWLKDRSSLALIGLGFVSSLVLIGLYYLSAWAVSGGHIPYSWILNANNADPAHPINPLDPTETFTTAGVWFGMALGATWLRLRGGFDAHGPLRQRAWRYLIGLAGVGILYAGLGRLFPRSEDLIGYSLRYLRYTLIGTWVAGGAPLVFIRMRLAKSSAGQDLEGAPFHLGEESLP